MQSPERLATITAVLALVGCAVGPDYRAPEPSLPEAFQAEAVLDLLNDAAEGEAREAQWWRGFGDAMLDALVDEALAGSFSVAAAAARVEAARADLRQAGARDALTVDAGADASAAAREELGAGGRDSSGTSAAGVLALGWLPDLFGRTRRRVESAEAALAAAEAQLLDTVLARSTEVAGVYLAYRGTQRQLELLRESVALQEKTLTIVRSRYRAGLSPELDLRRAETSVERLRADIPPLAQSLVNARQQLAVLSGRFPGALADRLAASGPLPTYAHRIDTPLPAGVLLRRPDVRAAEARLRGAVAQIGVAEAEFYPLFRLFAQVNVSTGGVSALPSMDVLLGSLGALADQFVADGGARRAAADAARAAAVAALADYRQALLDAAAQIERTLTGLQASLARQDSLAKAVRASERSFQQADRLYQLGLSSFLDVVDAQRVLASAEQALASERTGYATGVAELFRVLGAPVAVPATDTQASDVWR